MLLTSLPQRAQADPMPRCDRRKYDDPLSKAFVRVGRVIRCVPNAARFTVEPRSVYFETLLWCVSVLDGLIIDAAARRGVVATVVIHVGGRKRDDEREEKGGYSQHFH